jgi:hypothetical protein
MQHSRFESLPLEVTEQHQFYLQFSSARSEGSNEMQTLDLHPDIFP